MILTSTGNSGLDTVAPQVIVDFSSITTAMDPNNITLACIPVRILACMLLISNHYTGIDPDCCDRFNNFVDCYHQLNNFVSNLLDNSGQNSRRN